MPNAAKREQAPAAAPSRGFGESAMTLSSARRLLEPSARSNVPPFMVMDVMAAAARIEAAGGKVVHMEVGQPAVGAPAAALAAARAALGSGPLGYTEALGIPSLRARIASGKSGHALCAASPITNIPCALAISLTAL